MLQRQYDKGAEIDRDENRRARRLLVCALLLGFAVVAFGIYWWTGRLVVAYNDIGTSPIHHADGVVTGVTFLAAKKADPTPGALVTVSWEGKTEQFRTDSPPNPHQRVRVIYVVGKSGKVYIRGLEVRK